LFAHKNGRVSGRKSDLFTFAFFVRRNASVIGYARITVGFAVAAANRLVNFNADSVFINSGRVYAGRFLSRFTGWQAKTDQSKEQRQ